jgi:DNA repair protein RadC
VLLRRLLRPALHGRRAVRAAAGLLRAAGGLAGVLGRDPDLRSPAGLELAICREAVLRCLREPLQGRPLHPAGEALRRYLRACLGFKPREEFRVLFLDRGRRLIADERLGVGTVDHAPVYPREVARRSLELGAAAVVLVHNHPSGDPTPSSADVEMTRAVVDALAVFAVGVDDHLVVGRNGVASFAALGLV